MAEIDNYLGRSTIIVGDVKSGKTARTLQILHLFLKAGYAPKIAVLDLAPDMIDGIGGKMKPPPNEAMAYLTDHITAPRLTGKNEGHVRQLAVENVRTIERLFEKLQQQHREILFINDVTLYLHAGRLERLIAILNSASTRVINAYAGSALGDCELTRREKRLTENLIKTCNQVITMK